MNLLYFTPYKMNFGDELNTMIANRLMELFDVKMNFVDLSIKKWRKRTVEGKKFSFIGSIMHHLPDGVDVIGTGVNPLLSSNVNHDNIKFTILGLRGELSKNFMKERGFDVSNVVLGDPALLIPRLFPEWSTAPPGTGVGFIPHFNDIKECNKKMKTYRDLDIEVCYPNQRASDVIEFILSKKVIISSSLHGIIVAEMLNRDTRWVIMDGSSQSEGEFKYHDYFSATGRANVPIARNVPEALSGSYSLQKYIYDDAPLFKLLSRYFNLE